MLIDLAEDPAVLSVIDLMQLPISTDNRITPKFFGDGALFMGPINVKMHVQHGFKTWEPEQADHHVRNFGLLYEIGTDACMGVIATPEYHYAFWLEIPEDHRGVRYGLRETVRAWWQGGWIKKVWSKERLATEWEVCPQKDWKQRILKHKRQKKCAS